MVIDNRIVAFFGKGDCDCIYYDLDLLSKNAQGYYHDITYMTQSIASHWLNLFFSAHNKPKVVEAGTRILS
jgi:hypothetical protein